MLLVWTRLKFVFWKRLNNYSTIMYGITCIQRPLKGSNESGLLQQVVFKCRFYLVDIRRIIVSEQWSLKADGLLIQVVSNTFLTVSVDNRLYN